MKTMSWMMVVAVVSLVLATTVQAATIPSDGGSGGGGGLGATYLLIPDQVSISAGYENQPLDKVGNGWGGLIGDVIPRQLSAHAQTWWDGEQVRWGLTADVWGSFMPHDGTVSPLMSAYAALGNQCVQAHARTTTITFKKDGEWWQAEIQHGLDIRLDLEAQVQHYSWEESEGDVYDHWAGASNASARVENGFITDASSDFWRTNYNDRESDWQAQLRFSGIVAPDAVTITKMIPEPATIALLGLSAPLFRRRRRR